MPQATKIPKQISLSTIRDHVGCELGVSGWIDVDQPMIDLFADLTGDRQWVHVDVARAQKALGHTIAHGYLTLSLLPAFTAEIFELTGVGHGLNYGLDKVRFLAVVPAGARLRGRQTLTGAEAKGDGILLSLRTIIEIEGGDKPAAISDSLVLVFPDGADA
ncbi:MaoC family dehydratase [Sphingopyxis sp. Q841]|uniref:MaoC family dehydratase n=1 Tax=Sphingopyxis sp. Q841 TaxID=3458250 RepID=UPI0040353313